MLKKINKKNIILVKEEDQMVKFHNNTFDGIVSVGVIYYQPNPPELLKEFRRILKNGKRLSMLEFGKSLFFSPPPYLKNKTTLRKMFKDAGFKNIKIDERKKLLTTYFFVTAEK